MHFGFTDDELLLRDAVRALFERECPPDVVRAAWDAESLDRRVWDALAQMGVPGVLVAEASGGLGLDELSLVLLLEESGRAALPHPMVETTAVAAPLLGAGLGARLVATDLGGVLVPCAGDADLLLLRAPDGLRAFERAAVTVVPEPTVDRARRAGLVQCRPEDGTLVTGDEGAIDLAFDRGALGTAAQLVGLAQRMLELTVAYAKERRQFGVPIGSFQAVKHRLADALLQVEFARPAVHRAAWSVAHDVADRARDVSMAKAMASDAALHVAGAALQCHGAIGYTVEYDLHLWMKRAWALARAWGDGGWHRDRVGRAIGV